MSGNAVMNILNVVSNGASAKSKSEMEAILQALSLSNAVIEFKPDGTILTANSNFLNAVGYELGEVQGQHHSIFVDEKEKASEEYREFWGGAC